MQGMIHLVKVLASKAGGLFQKITCSFFGKQQDLKVLNIYGISFRPPDDSFGVAFRANNRGDDIFVAVDRPDLRFTGLSKGEIKIGDYLTGDYIYFRADGTIEIKGTTALDILAPLVTMSGALAVTGIGSAADFFSGIVSGLTHTHSGVETGAGVSGPPIGGGGGPAVVLTVVDGGTGESTVQAAIDALTAVAAATNEHVLTKDTASGKAIWKVSASGGGEANTGSNVGIDGIGVFKQKAGVNLEFKNIAPASSRISVVANGNDIDLDVVQSAIIHTNIQAGSGADHSLLGATPGVAVADKAVITDSDNKISITSSAGITQSLHQDNASAAAVVQKLTQDDADEAFTDFIGSIAKSTTASISSSGIGLASDMDDVAAPDNLVWEHTGMLKINQNGNDVYIPFYAAR